MLDEGPGQIATLVKMGRVALLVPFVIGIAILWNRRNSKPGGLKNRTRGLFHFVPWFVWGFAATAVLGTLGLIPDLTFPSGGHYVGTELLSSGGKFLLTLAMAAIGLQVGVKSMLQTGGRTVFLALAVWGLLFAVVFAILVARH